MSEPVRKVTVALLTLCQSTQAVALGGIALLLPLIREDLDLNYSQAGLIGVASGLIYAFMQIPSGFLSDRIGAKRMFAVGLIGTNVTMITFTLIDNYNLLLANQMLSGFFRAMVFAPGLLLVQAEFPADRRATASGLFLVGGLGSNMLINLFGPALLPVLGWRGLLVAAALSALVVAFAYLLIGTERPRPALTPLKVSELPRIMSYRVIWWAGSVHFSRHCVAYAWNFWLTTILVAGKGLPLASAAAFVALGAAVTTLANFVGGYLSDRLQAPTMVMGVTFLALAVSLAALAQAESLLGITVAVVAAAAFVQLSFGPMFAYPVWAIGPRSAGFVSGVSNTFANIGGLTGAFLVGALKDYTGSFHAGLYALSGLCLVAIVATGMLDRVGRAHRAEAAEREARAMAADPATVRGG
jgi:ACS family D-galactonate transporter-like MFS transporter